MEFGIGRPKINVGSSWGSVLVGGQIGMCLVRLCGSRNVAVWSKGMYAGRAKTVGGAGVGFPENCQWVCRCRDDCGRFGRYSWQSSKGQCRWCNACAWSKDCV